ERVERLLNPADLAAVVAGVAVERRQRPRDDLRRGQLLRSRRRLDGRVEGLALAAAEGEVRHRPLRRWGETAGVRGKLRQRRRAPYGLDLLATEVELMAARAAR